MKKSILAIGAHPDDIEIGCGGTLAKLAENGDELTYVILTSGEEGILTANKSTNAERRETEAKTAAKILGAKAVVFLREPDGLTHVAKASRIKLISLIRELKPEIVFTHAASDHFPDHRVVHNATLAAVMAAQGPWYPDAGMQPFTVKSVMGYEVWTPISKFQTAVDIGSVIEKKKAALRAHSSQVDSVDYVGAIEGLARYRGTMSMIGRFAEVFKVEKGGFDL